MKKHSLSLFRHFKNILRLNNKIIEEIAYAEKMLGGDYLFDSAFLSSFVTNICENAREVVYNLNSMTGGRYLLLYDRLDSIKAVLEDILYGGEGPWSNALVVEYSAIKWDFDEIVGEMAATLLHMKNDFGINTPDGFSITKRAYLLFLEENNIVSQVKRVYERYSKKNEIIDQIDSIFEKSYIPSKLEEEILVSIDRLEKRCKKLNKVVLRCSPLVLEDENLAEDIESIFNKKVLCVPKDEVVYAYKELVKARFMPDVVYALDNNYDFDRLFLCVCVEKELIPVIIGMTHTRAPCSGLGEKDYIVISASFFDPANSNNTKHNDKYCVSRTYPYIPIKTIIPKRDLKDNCSHPFGGSPFSPAKSGFMRGSSLLCVRDLINISEISLLCEKVFNTPRRLKWMYDKSHSLVMLENKKISSHDYSTVPSPERVEDILKKFNLVFDGLGETVQSGVAAGKVVHIDPLTDPKDVPIGAICVSKYGHPMLTPILKRAGAIITDVGNLTDHLATIAREFKVPAIFGTKIGSKLLKDGMEVTVDAGEKKVYEGIVEELVEMGTRESLDFFESPELKKLRRILSQVAPLYLTDPSSEDFSPKGCKTIHDIIHYCHEKAIDGLIRGVSSGDIKVKSGVEEVYKLDVNIPLEINIIDLGDGVVYGPKKDSISDKGKKKISIKDIESIPFLALLKGLLSEEAWDREPVSFGVSDFVSSMVRPVSVFMSPPAYGGGNLAIIAREYVNLSLFLGYHFNVIDSYVSEVPDHNYIYFRFGGGFAEETKRKRRADLIKWVLEDMGFDVELKGDIVIGKIKGMDMESLRDILEQIGRLIGYTRQLDVRMTDEDIQKELYRQFVKFGTREEK